MPTKIKQLGRPNSYLFWNRSKIQAIVTTAEKGAITIDNNVDGSIALKIGGRPVHTIPNTESVIVKHNDLNQISSITNASGITIKYEYDALGRLQTIRDHKGHVISYTSYHIQDNGHNFIMSISYPEYMNRPIFQYYDGLGRPTLKASNTNNVNGTFVYAMQEYDQRGRESVTWNPVSIGKEPEYIKKTEFKSFSKNFYNDSYGFSTTEYDALGRVVKITRPGESWYKNNKTIQKIYGFNSPNEVKHYNDSANGNTLSFDYYASGDLTSETHISEDCRKSVVFKDNVGNTILERVIDGEKNVDTYYVYDKRGLLTWVLQPMYQKDPDNKKFAFHYQYNDKNLVINKTIPGCQPITFEYDKYNRVIKMQDGVLSQAGKFRSYTYDPLGRIETQGICLSNGTKAYDEIVNYYDKDVVLKRNEKKLFVSNSCKYGLGQLTASWQRASNGDPILTTFSYDEYGRLQKREEMLLDDHLSETQITYNTVGDIISEKTIEYDYSNGVYVPKLESNVQNAYYVHTNLLKTSLLSMTEYKKGVRQGTKNITMQDLSYNDLGRVIANNRSGNAGDIRYAYDDLHGWLTGINSGAGFEQHLYREIEGKVKRWDGSISAMTWKAGANDAEHRYDYTYDALNRMTDAEYSEESQIASCPPLRRNFWEDDNIVILPDPQNCTQGNYGEHIVYDMNSNIIQMQRSGMLNDKSYGLIDNLGISYNGNQRTKVTDAITVQLTYNGAFDFVDGTNTGSDYAYNQNGALSKDLNKGITKIEYDLLGNPKKVTLSDSRSIEYVYSADGRRLRAIHKSKISSEKTDYIGSLILKDNKPQMYRFSGGYFDFKDDGSMNDSHYYIADFQGNNRMVVNGRTGDVEQVNSYYPYGGIIANLSSGQDEQEFKFGDKKLDRTYGLDLYDFEARQYDAIAPWFTSIDPLAEKYYSISPYAYCAGDPVNYVDRDGRAIIFVNGYRPLHGHHDMSTSKTRRCNNQGVYDQDNKHYWKGIDENYQDLYNDKNAIYTSGSAGMSSQADERYDEGFVKADLFHEKVQSGDIKLDKDENGNPIEPIRLVAHSMGGATAAGMAERLTELGYNVEVIVYIHPHQAKDIKHPKGISGKQYDKKHDRVVSNFGKGRKKRGKIDGIKDENYHEDNSDFWDLKGGHGVAKHRKNVGK